MSEVKVYKDSVLTVKKYSTVSYKAVPKLGFRITSNNATGSGTAGDNGYTIPTPTIGLVNDVVLWDKEQQKKVIFKPQNFDKIETDKYTPIGVMVVPMEHDVYGDGSGAMMSLKYMSCNDPDKGGAAEGMCWGGYGVEVPGIPNYTQVPIIGTASAQTDTISKSAGNGYLPSDNLTNVQSKIDEYSKYDSSASSSPIPSPFDTTEVVYGQNSLYFATEYGSGTKISNALADFEGDEHSVYLWDLATSQSDWKTNVETTTVFATQGLKIEWPTSTTCEVSGNKGDTVIFKCMCADCKAEGCQCGCKDEQCKTIIYNLPENGVNTIEFEQTEEEGEMSIMTIEETNLPPIDNKSDAGYYPAACCCWRYHTEGTNQGDWYLPAMGELGYVMARLSAINYTINQINQKWGTVAVALSTSNTGSNRLWSSSEYSSYSAWSVNPDVGNVNYYGKNNSYSVRAFARVGVAS